MKTKNIFSVLLLMVSVQVLAQNKAEMHRLPNGVQYKIFTSNTGPKIKLNDVITFDFIQKTDKDSILGNSFDSKRPATIQVGQGNNVADLMDFFPLLGLNDSAIVKIPTDSIFNTPEMAPQRPPFFPKGSSFIVVLKINKVQSMEEVMAEQEKKMEVLKNEEAVKLAKYLTENKINATTTASGLRYIITSPSAKPRPSIGDTVLVNYIGRTLEGKVFDSSIEAEAKKAGLEQPGRNYEPISVVLSQGRIIPGWEEGLLLVNEGAKARFIIPSDLAYGPQGASEDIKPFSTLLFDLEIVKVNPAKKTEPAPASKPGVVEPAN